MATLPSRKKSFDVIGESRTARDGTSRQKLLMTVDPGDGITLERQSDNRHDPNAILVVWEGYDLGFLPRDDAAALAPALDAGRAYRAHVERVTGCSADYPSYGLKVAVAWGGQPLPEPRPLSPAQIASRRGRLAAEGRKRSASGAFVSSKAQKGSGCSVMLLFSACAPVAASYWAIFS